MEDTEKREVDKRIPVTVFTGFLGSGKTTIIKNLVEVLPQTYEMVWLKNEFGNVAVDSEFAKESNIDAVEMLNGCLCCVLVGKLQNALEEILENYHPQRIIIETSGSAYPEPIALEINKMEDKLVLDGIVTVIDALNFSGYKDTSITARQQAESTDLILINKHELVDEKQLHKVMDDVYALNSATPKVKTDAGKVNPDLIFGLDSQLFQHTSEQVHLDKHHHDNEVDVLNVITEKEFERQSFEKFLSGLPRMDYYRIKGMVKLDDKFFMLNYVFGRYDLFPMSKYSGASKLVFMGKNFRGHQQNISQGLGVGEGELEVVNLR